MRTGSGYFIFAFMNAAWTIFGSGHLIPDNIGAVGIEAQVRTGSMNHPGFRFSALTGQSIRGATLRGVMRTVVDTIQGGTGPGQLLRVFGTHG